MFVVLAEEVPPELVTIASRCVQVDFAPWPAAALVDRLVAEGVEPAEAADEAAAGAGGSLRPGPAAGPATPARQRAGRPGTGCPTAWTAPVRPRARLVDELLAAIEDGGSCR